MAGALGFEPRMQVPKPVPYRLATPQYYLRITQKNKIYIVIDDLHQ